jgi:hypothetical protein
MISNGKITETKPEIGNIIGVSYVDVIHLPNNAKINILYNGDKKGEGMFNLKKI